MVHDTMWTVQLQIAFVLWLARYGTSSQLIARPRSNLCVKNDTPCAPDGSCTMFYFPVNSTECADWSYTNFKTPISHLALGRVQINTYTYEDRSYSQTAFNLTFSNIKWTQMKFRIMQNGNPTKNTCRQFLRTDNSSLDAISYDCIWSDEGYEGKPYILDYQAKTVESTEAVRVVFNVPFVPETPAKEKTRLLCYVQASPVGLARTRFHVFWPKLPDELQVQYYRVYIFYNDSGTESILHEFEVQSCEDDLCVFETQKWFGIISFGVQPVFEGAIQGIISRTQYFDLGPDKVSPLLLTLLFCSIFVPILLFSVLILRKKLIQRSARSTPPKILIIHSPTTTPHLHVTEAFVNYLNTYCQVIALMDELDIPRSQSRDPFIWCSESIAAADVVCIVASPFFGKLRSSSALYRTDRLLLRLLREQYGSGSKTRYCVIQPPYTSASDVPIEASSLKKLNMINDLGKLVRMARYRWPIPEFLAAAFDDPFEQNGQELIDCIETAETDLREGRSQYSIKAQESDTSDPSGVARAAEEETPPLARLITNDTQERKKENKLLAQELFSDYLGNLEHLNLLGDKEKPVILAGNRATVCSFDLDSLKL